LENATYYDILGVPEDASQEEIREAYRKLAFRWHPDRHGGDPWAEERFKQIAAAYSVLRDPQSRAEYDARLRSPEPEEREPSPEERMNVEVAVFLFFREMYKYAFALLLMKVPLRKIAGLLVEEGCPPNVAVDIVKSVEKAYDKLVMNIFLKKLAWAGAWMAVGSGIAWWIHSSTPHWRHPSYTFPTILIVVGGLQLFRALAFLFGS